jgi:hypothetical protein
LKIRFSPLQILKYAIVSLVLLFFIYLLSLFISRRNFYQWDFKTFYYAGKAHAAGLNPYGLTNLAAVAKRPVHFRFRYPPLTLWFFRFFSLFNIKTACVLFLSIKCALLAILFFLWIKFFLKKEADVWFVVFSLLAFNTSIFVDLAAGNISIFEQFGLWLAFVCLMKRRLFLFCLLVFLSAQFKITPLFFLVLLLFIKAKKKYLYFFGTIFVFGAIQAISYLTTPLYEDFIIFGGQFEEYMQSSYTLLSELMTMSGRLLGVGFGPIVLRVVFLFFVGVVFLMSWRALSILTKHPLITEENKDRLKIFLICLVYALTVPRFLAYSHMILIVPAYYILKRYMAGMGGVLVGILAVLHIPQSAGMPGMEIPLDLLWKYHSVTIAFGLWAICLFRIFHIHDNRKNRLNGMLPSEMPSASPLESL